MLRLLGTILLSVAAFAANGAHTQARLVLATETARPGETVMAGIHLRMEPRWHTYWRNAGESGMPTKIAWELPSGITAGELQWPVPEKFSFGGLTTYVYHDEVVLLVPLQVAADLPQGPLRLNAKVSWLECEELCIPGDQHVSARLTVGDESKPSPDADLIDAWKKKLPQDGAALSALAAWGKAADDDMRALFIEWTATEKPETTEFFPYGSENFELALTTKPLPYSAGKARLKATVRRFDGDWPGRIAGLIVQKTSAGEEAYEVSLPVAARAEGDLAALADAGEAFTLASLLAQLGLAFLGGLILNIMPCVFPVIALKILGFVQQSQESPRRVFQLGLIYSAGVVASFLALAAMVIIVKAAGGEASWGMQLQNPQFSLALTVLITLVALNLFGAFEINLSGRAMSAAGQLASRQGAGGAFFTGILATVLATPCTAPFLAPALGFAFALTPPLIALFFVTVGLGLAFPYIVLSWKPAWLRFLPKPGRWMERFKIAMGFPMLAVAIWLFSFTAKRFGPTGPLWLGLFLVVVALAAWVWGEFVQRGGRRQGVAMAISLALLLFGYAYALEGELHWRSPAGKGATEMVQGSPDGIAWQAWSARAVETARAEGRPVLVDFTADWCLTCQFNKVRAIEVPEVRTKLKEIDAVALIGDFTDKDPVMGAELKKFGSAGVPLVLVYPRDPSKPPIVLPTLLTKGIVLEALNEAAQ